MKKEGTSYQDRLLAAFILGVAGGTALANLAGREMKEGLMAFPFSAAGESGAGSAELFCRLLRWRAGAVALGWLAGLTPCGAGCFLAAAGYAGLSMAVSLSVFTFQKGITGPLWFLLTLLPHFPLYLACWSALASWAGKRPAKMRIPAFLCLLAAAAAGAAAEAWGAPVLWGLALKFI